MISLADISQHFEITPLQIRVKVRIGFVEQDDRATRVELVEPNECVQDFFFPSTQVINVYDAARRLDNILRWALMDQHIDELHGCEKAVEKITDGF